MAKHMSVGRGPLNPEYLISAYSQGYFPMPDPNTGQIVWLKPDPRAIIPLNDYHVSRSLQTLIRKGQYRVSLNQAFTQVMEGCADRNDTWITSEFKEAYYQLHQLGFCHSLEVWAKDQDGQHSSESLVGGTYGVAVRGAFFAESMFHRKSNMSKIALFHLVEHLKEMGYQLLECQFVTPHLASLGATAISDLEYMIRLNEALNQSCSFEKKRTNQVS